ncbi:hypothetical protein AGMMS50249_4760 [candidate division SR1 bacterium]|nr:hypothetical protein AGMMS50249_4760 [candidate division SR1 bacterium]
MVETVGQPINSRKNMYFQIKPFKENDRGVQHREKIVENLISLKEKTISFVVSGNSQDIKFYVKLPTSFKNYFENTFYSSFPTSDLADTVNPKFSKSRIWVSFAKDESFKTRDFFQKDGSYLDPMNDLLALFQNVDKNSRLDLFFDYTFKLEETSRVQARGMIKRFFKRVWTPSDSKKDDKGSEKNSEGQIKKEIYFALSYSITTEDSFLRDGLEKSLNSAFSPFVSNGKPVFTKTQVRNYCQFSEVVNFFHMPTQANFVKGLDYTLYRKLPYPTNIPDLERFPDVRELTTLGNTDYRGDKIKFGIKEEDKFRHMYIVGKTGTGKSTFISNMIISDMTAGNGVCVLDPHGELIDTIIESIPSNRINDVILFDVSDSEYPIGFNLLQADNEDEKNRIASGVVSTFEKLFDNSRGPRLEYILRNVVLSIIDYPNATLMHILRVLTDKEFREEVVSHVKDPVLLKFWNNEFNKWQDRQREEAVAPITNKVGQFLSSRLVRNIFGQPRTRLSMRKAMDEGKIILVNLSKGKIGEDNANMIGSLLVTKIQIDAMARADTVAYLRRPFYLYIDEFQNFASRSFASILSEARKYKLSLIVANQYTSQLADDIKDAIFGNVGTIVSFTLGYDDAQMMTSQFKEMIGTNDLISLPKYTAYTRLMIDGISSDPFSMKTLPPLPVEEDVEHIEKIRKQSRQRYSMERGQLENLMTARNKKTFSVQEKIAQKSRLEGLGLTPEETKTLNDMEIQQNLRRMNDVMIGGELADGMIMNLENHVFKYVFFTKPPELSEVATLQFKPGEEIEIEDGKRLKFAVSSYQHNTQKLGEDPLVLRVGSKSDIRQQLTNMQDLLGLEMEADNPMQRVPNIEKLAPAPSSPVIAKDKGGSSNLDQNASNASSFAVNDIKLGETFDGYVKLIYNYGIFVTVKGVEGLLHKNWIATLPDGVDRKKYYNPGDKIRVRAKEFKDIDGEKKVVRSQK